MQNRGSSSSEYLDYRADVESARARQRLAWAVILFTLVLGCTLLYVFVSHYYGDDGVRVVGVVLALLALILIVIGLGAGVMFIATSLSQQHHDNVLTGLVRFQAADDRGEIARTMANGYATVVRTGNQLDTRTLTVANQIARQMVEADRRAMDAQRLLTEQQQATRQQWEQEASSGRAQVEW